MINMDNKVTGHTVLDVPAVFGTIGHSILMDCGMLYLTPYLNDKQTGAAKTVWRSMQTNEKK